jgi:RNA binding exosome subunit
VGLHRVSWRATGSAVSNIDAIADAVAWLAGGQDAVHLDQTTSYHGTELVLIGAEVSRKKNALESLARIGAHNLQELNADLKRRMDENHVLHFRLSLDALIEGEVVLAERAGPSTVKCQAKFEVYPGQSAEEQIHATMNEAIQVAPEDGTVV